MISIDLARALRDAGLVWQPANGDRFFIPDRDLDAHTFAIADMSVEIRSVPGGREIAFNGAVEWALDAIRKDEVVWLPSEFQLRTQLAGRFRSLERIPDGYRCSTEDGTFDAVLATDAYALAVLATLRG
ncbi:MAG TPA: pilus assembly protein CpaE [Acidimicrobiia bacterium]|nr:pilus assembly protein CpaE [Acidimicrobiia bacterium]